MAVEKCEGDLEQFIFLMRQPDSFWEEDSAPKLLPNPNIINLFREKRHLLKCSRFLRGLMFQIMEGVKFLHDNKIIHRDLKPQNILINRLLKAKISDMGLSKQLNTEMESYHTEAVKGSIGWQPAEVILNEADYVFKNTHKT